MPITGTNNARIVEWIEDVTAGTPAAEQVRYDLNVPANTQQIKILYAGVLSTFPSTEKVLKMLADASTPIYLAVANATELLLALAMAPVLKIYCTEKITISSEGTVYANLVSSKYIFAPSDDYINFTGVLGTTVFELHYPEIGADQDIDIQFNTSINAKSNLLIKATGNYFASGTYETTYTEHPYKYRLRLSTINPETGTNISVEGALSDPSGGGAGFMYDKVEVANNFGTVEVVPGSVYGGRSGALWTPWVNGSVGVKVKGTSSCAVQSRNVIASGFYPGDGLLMLMEILGRIDIGTSGGGSIIQEFRYAGSAVALITARYDGGLFAIKDASNSPYFIAERVAGGTSLERVRLGNSPSSSFTGSDAVTQFSGGDVSFLFVEMPSGTSISYKAYNAYKSGASWYADTKFTANLVRPRLEVFNDEDFLGGTKFFVSTTDLANAATITWRETHRIDEFGHVIYAAMRTGVDQATAGAIAGELWADSSGFVKLGV